MEQPASRVILGVRVDATSYERASEQISAWAVEGRASYVCACNVHMVMEAYDDPSFAANVNGADLVTPDGMPLVWALRAMGVQGASRVYGPDLMRVLCRKAAETALPIGLYGGAPETLAKLVLRLELDYPGLKIAYTHSPPFGVESGRDDLRAIQEAGVKLLFVALGCPKQERWMADHVGQIRTTMVGVGAAFDFLAGTKPEAPDVLQQLGLEWAFRLASEPRRLWRRYARHNPRFVMLFLRQLAGR